MDHLEVEATLSSESLMKKYCWCRLINLLLWLRLFSGIILTF